jgi:hypothetical protein
MANTMKLQRLPQRAHLIVGRKPQRVGDLVDLPLVVPLHPAALSTLGEQAGRWLGRDHRPQDLAQC